MCFIYTGINQGWESLPKESCQYIKRSGKSIQDGNKEGHQCQWIELPYFSKKKCSDSYPDTSKPVQEILWFPSTRLPHARAFPVLTLPRFLSLNSFSDISLSHSCPSQATLLESLHIFCCFTQRLLLLLISLNFPKHLSRWFSKLAHTWVFFYFVSQQPLEYFPVCIDKTFFGLALFLLPSFYLPLVVSVVFNSWLLLQPVKLSSSLSLLQAPTWKMFHFPIWVTDLEKKKSHTHLTTSKPRKTDIKKKEILKRILKELCCICK